MLTRTYMNLSRGLLDDPTCISDETEVIHLRYEKVNFQFHLVR